MIDTSRGHTVNMRSEIQADIRDSHRVRKTMRGAENLRKTRKSEDLCPVNVCLRVIMCEIDIDVEKSSFIYTPLWSRDCCLPVEHVIASGAQGDAAKVFLLKVGDFALYSFEGSLVHL